METRPTAHNSHYFGIVRQLRSKKYNGNKNQNGHKGNHQIHHPIRIKMHQKIPHREAVVLYPWGFGLYINYHNNDRKENKHKAQSPHIFFDDVSVYNSHFLKNNAQR